MDWIKIISGSIDDIENNLCDNITAESLAKKYSVSSFYFQKMFSIICGCTVGEYVRNRRLTLAGGDVTDTKNSIIDIALKFGYESNESFTRAFTRFHGTTPSEVRKSKSNLKVFSKISPLLNLTGGNIIMGNLSERGYVVRESGSVYYTEDMDRTLEWFKNVLGWYGQIEQRNEDSVGSYGCVSHIPTEIEALHITPFTGMHMFKGTPLKQMVGFMLVQGLDNLYANVKNHGWNDISEIIDESWGARSCTVTTIDGSILKFFEIIPGMNNRT